MRTSDYYYELPYELIAQTPIEPRDSSRMLVYDRVSGGIEHKRFSDITDYLTDNDVLVINNTKVLPARIFGNGAGGGKIEFLLHKRLNLTDWQVLARPARKAKAGCIFDFGEGLTAEVLQLGDMGNRTVRFSFSGVFEDVLRRIGHMPLPPYIREKLKDKSRYQTVYAKTDGSSAAPTAGLHFTPELLLRLKEKGVAVIEVLLHVGLGTFRPVQAEEITDHKMHSEHYEISEAAAEQLNEAKRSGKRIVCVGTTSVRVLESAADSSGYYSAGSGETDIFIYPPYKFKTAGALITNFHLPESTLIMLVSAFCGRENTLRFYNEAIKERYRFFSFGDACLLL